MHDGCDSYGGDQPLQPKPAPGPSLGLREALLLTPPRATGPRLDVLAQPDPTRREFGDRLGEVRVRLDDGVDALAAQSQHFGDLGDTDEVQGHEQNLEPRWDNFAVLVGCYCRSTVVGLLSIDMGTDQMERHRLQVGGRAQEIVSEVLRYPEANRSVLQLTQAAARLQTVRPISYRPRESHLEAVTAAGVYLRRFALDSEWALLGTEVTAGACRFDLVWRHAEHGVLIDELKLGVGRGGELVVRSQIDRYLLEGTQLWSDFVGVRLCSVHEPALSRLFRPGRRRSALVSDSHLARELAAR